jgi:RNA 2',3'-cyclic 3'-phosphodiesterase
MDESFEKCRAFIAVRLPENCLAAVVSLQRRLDSRLSSAALKWTRKEQLHLTLSFLGQVPVNRLAELIEALKGACKGSSLFKLQLSGIGCFPNFDRPNVIWQGIAGDTALLCELQGRIAAAAEGFGDHAKEARAYHPHLTLARVKPPQKEIRRIGESLKKMQSDPCGEWAVEEVELIRSELSPQGSRYTTVAAIKL